MYTPGTDVKLLRRIEKYKYNIAALEKLPEGEQRDRNLEMQRRLLALALEQAGDDN